VIPVLYPDEMAEVDREAPDPVEVLVERAGFAVAHAARRMMRGAYGRRVNVVAGRGNNGADGRTAAAFLAGWGASVRVLSAGDLEPGQSLPGCDLVIDAAYGTGLSRPYLPVDTGGAPVLAVDIPSGLSGVTGKVLGGGGALRAERTVTFAALKPGLLVGDGPDLCGDVEVVDIGLGPLVGTRARTWVVTDGDVAAWLPERKRQAHKWQSAVEVVGGSPAMPGAALMSLRGALRAGAGYALVSVPGAPPGGSLPPGEHVSRSLPEHDWGLTAAGVADRVRAIVVGPGLGSSAFGHNGESGRDTPVVRLLESARGTPAVVDADGLSAVGDLGTLRQLCKAREAPTVVTPHEGEFSRLVGRTPHDDRIADVRDIANETGAVVLLKGSPTVVAEPGGRSLISTAGSSRLATAGTGDVLSGVIGAFLARGLPGLEAAALGAHTHGRAAAMGRGEGLVASDLPDLVAAWLSELER
jgi:ADP-dependent NAD(P)H-hydrate dehydratase / NAD(P)H-hydrate epimerase